MTKKDRDWSKMVIYKICCNDLNIIDIYIGHTCNLVKRRNAHKKSCNNEKDKSYNINLYQFIRSNGGWDNWSVIEIDKCPCLDFEEATKIERFYIENLKATLNKVIPTRTKKEYYIDNIETIIEKRNKSYKKNKDIILEKAKIYRENNKIIILEKAKQIYEKNRENILEKVLCECGCKVARSSLSTHKKSKKHLNYISGKEIII